MKRIISLLLIVATLFATLTINVGAARQEEYLSEVALVYEDSVEDAREAIEGTDWKLLEHDLNANADAWIDDGVYLIYKTTTDVEEAITDLRIMDMYGGYSSSNYDKQLEASRKAYMQAVSYIRITAAEFKALYVAGDEMAKIAYRQMNYYKDSNTNLLMGDFMLNIPSDEALVTVLLEGNGYAVTNLISLLAVGISGGSDKPSSSMSVPVTAPSKPQLHCSGWVPTQRKSNCCCRMISRIPSQNTRLSNPPGCTARRSPSPR